MRRGKVEVRPGELEALLVGDARAGLQAEQDVVRLGILGPHVVGIVGGDERQIEAPGDIHDAGAGGLLLGDPMVLELEEIVVAAEYLQVLARHGFSAVRIAAQDGLLQFSTQACGQADQPLGVLGEQLLVDARPVVVALEVRRRHQLDQVPIAGLVAGQQHQVIGIPVGAHLAVVPRPLRHVHLAPDDRCDVRRLGPGVEIDDAVQHAVVGDAHRRLSHGAHLVDQLTDTCRAVEQRVLRVRVQVHEGAGIRLHLSHCTVP